MSTHPRDPETSGELVLASDAEREQVVGRLNAAVAEGRLTLSEFADRTQAVYATRTRADLAPFLADLPEPTSPPQRPSDVEAGEYLLVGPIKRRGRWRIPARSRLGVTWGTIKLDLRDAELTGPDVYLHASTVLGTIKVVVPEHVHLIVEGSTKLGARAVDENHLPANSQAPTVRLRLDTGVGTVKVYVQREGKRRWYF